MAVVLGIPVAAFALTASPAVARDPAVAAAASGAPVLDVVPKPASVLAGSGHFTLVKGTRIVVRPGPGRAAELAVARDLAAYLRPATGYPLPVVAGALKPGDIQLRIGDPAALKPAGRA